ncbi:MAG: hypothetical protein FJZ67_07195 [Bacteroidetes bacterium]|nr:hypothetical protein [Bacteroidota bacterium]
MKNSTKKSRIKNYLAATGSIIAGNVALGQNLQYTDVNPDVLLDKNSGPFEMDFNNDVSIDMTFQVASFNGGGSSTYSGIPFTFVYNGSQVGVIPGANGGVQGQVIGSNSTLGVTALNAGDPISAANNFGSQSAVIGAQGTVSVPAFNLNYAINQGEFLGVSQKFLGMKFSAGASIHYGWVRLSLDTLDPAGLKLTIHDYAYNGDADQPINAGDPAASIIVQAALESKVSFFVTPDVVRINVTPDLIGGELHFINIDGKATHKQFINDIGTEIKLEDFSTGIYMLEAVFNDGKLAKKVYVK